MKHAYLIITHHEFEILRHLVKALDDERNDIYIHFDKKVDSLPLITTDYAGIYILSNRIDVRWGDVSQIESELVLFQEASKYGPYGYYHLLSGVDLPLRSQNFIHSFFAIHQGKEFIDFHQGNAHSEIERKVQCYHLYPKYFRSGPSILGFLRKALRFIFLRIQNAFGARRYPQTVFKKGLNWVSVSQEFVCYLLHKQEEIIRNYQYTFCADEIFLQTVCWHSSFREKLFNTDHGRCVSMRLTGWQGDKLVDWENKDFEVLMNSDALFARKFSSKHMDVVDRILDKIASNV